MPTKYPYTPVQPPLMELIGHLRKNFPNIVNADVLKKLELAPKNEATIINVLMFLGILDDEGRKTSEAVKVFTLHEDSDFQKHFAEMISRSYKGLFDLHGDQAWTIEFGKLVAYFRQSDETSEVTGTRQAKTFESLAILAGKRSKQPPENQKTKAPGVAQAKPKKKGTKGIKINQVKPEATNPDLPNGGDLLSREPQKLRELGISVKIEINLPATDNQDVYDKIFRSIRENLIDDVG